MVMISEHVIAKAQEFFPDLQVKDKSTSPLMLFLAKVLFFNKSFMNYNTTLGSTIYMPANQTPTYSLIVFLHELCHVHDAKNISKPIFFLMYLFPQVLTLLFLPLMLVCWKLFLPLTLLCLLPLPAYFRAQFEKRGYFISMYVAHKLNPAIDMEKESARHLAKFSSSAYYWMWLFDLTKEFKDAVVKIKSGSKPFEDPIFDIIDQVVAAV